MSKREAGFSGFETLIGLLVIAIIGVVGFSIYNRQVTKPPSSPEKLGKVRTVSEPKISLLGSYKDLGNGFQSYSNTESGFALDIPKTVNDGYGAPCTYELNTNTGYYSYRPKGGMEPVIIVEDGNEFTVAPKVTYQLSNSVEHNSIGYFGSCAKTYTTAKVIRDSRRNPANTTLVSALGFVVTDAGSLADVTSWVKTYFQDSTIITADVGKAANGEWKHIVLDCTSSDPCTEFNFKYDLRYYEKQKKLVYFAFGQAGNLQKPNNGGSYQFYDNQVADSFRLLAN